MSENLHWTRLVTELAEKEGRFKPDAYVFVAETVSIAVAALARPRHVSARELLEAVRKRLGDEFGPFAGAVLEEWGVATAADIGRIVYSLIAIKVLNADANDSPADFDIVFELVESSFAPPSVATAEPPGKAPQID